MTYLKTIFIIALIFFSSNCLAGKLEADAGKYLSKELDVSSKLMNWKIHELFDQDPSYAPTVSIQFYSKQGEIIFSTGIVKTDGVQGLSSYIALGGGENIIKQSAVHTNLDLNKNYTFGYSFPSKNRVLFIISGKEVSSKIPEYPAKIAMVVSGMVVELEKP
ncbi:MAG: hypothetical protein K6L76_06545 [Agarilytica sp.]